MEEKGKEDSHKIYLWVKYNVRHKLHTSEAVNEQIQEILLLKYIQISLIYL